MSRPIRSSPEEFGRPALFKTLAARSSVGKVNDEVGLALARDFLGDQFGGFSGGVVSELLPNVAATTQSSKLSSGTT